MCLLWMKLVGKVCGCSGWVKYGNKWVKRWVKKMA